MITKEFWKTTERAEKNENGQWLVTMWVGGVRYQEKVPESGLYQPIKIAYGRLRLEKVGN